MYSRTVWDRKNSQQNDVGSQLLLNNNKWIKKMKFKISILSCAFAIVLIGTCYAADVGVCTETLEIKPTTNIKVLKVKCTADTGNIVKTLTYSSALQGHMLMQVDITPIVAPTAASDLYIYYGSGVKAGGTDLENTVTTTPTHNYLATGNPILWGTWTIDVDNNAVAAAQVVFEFYFYGL